MLVYTIQWLNRNEQHWKGKGKHGKGKKGVCVVSQLFLPETVVKSCVSLTSKYIFVLNFHHENNCSSYQQQIILYYTSGILLLIIVNAVYVLTNPDICYICNTAYVKKTQYLLYLSSYAFESTWLIGEYHYACIQDPKWSRRALSPFIKWLFKQHDLRERWQSANQRALQKHRNHDW